MSRLRPLFLSLYANLKRRDGSRDWLVLLALSAAAFSSVLIWNILFFDGVVNEKGAAAPAETPAQSINRASLDAIRAIFKARAAEKGKYDAGVYRYTDPSR